MTSIMKQNNNQFHFLSFCLGIVLIALLIQAGGLFHGNRIVFPDIREIWQALLRLASGRKLYVSISVTIVHLLEALAVSAGIGIPLGIAEGVSYHFRSLVMPLKTLVRSLPMIVLVILIMTVSRYDIVPVIAASAVLIPLISEAVSEGCRSIEPEMRDVYRLNSGFNGTVLLHVYIPLISGYLKQAFQSAAGMGLKVVVSAEYLVQTQNSLGKAVYSSSYFLEYAEIYAYALIMILLVLVITEIPVRIVSAAGKKRSRRVTIPE